MKIKHAETPMTTSIGGLSVLSQQLVRSVTGPRAFFVLVALSAPFLAACAKSDVPVPIHGVNHTAEPFRFILIDPVNKDNRGGGEMINSYGAGGTVCCYMLPEKWRPGLQVEISETYWLPMNPDKTVPSLKKSHIVEIPPYAYNKAGELWVIRAPGGKLSLVSSDFQPDHPKWPGVIKGWPVPSIEFQREYQDKIIKDAELTVNVFLRSLDELNKNPASHANEAWAFSSQHEADVLKGFRGPDDPAYRAMLRKAYEKELFLARKELELKKAARP